MGFNFSIKKLKVDKNQVNVENKCEKKGVDLRQIARNCSLILRLGVWFGFH